MTTLTSVRKCRKQHHARDVRGCWSFFCPLEKKSTNRVFLSIFKVQTEFAPISRPDKDVGLLKIYFKPMIKKLKFSTLVAKSDLRFKIH